MIREPVPCRGCTACCKRECILLLPEHGDDVSSYENIPAPLTDKAKEALGGAEYRSIPQKENGDCFYLTATGCSIWERAPYLCRTFDCRRAALMYPKKEQRRLIKAGVLDREILQAGLDRVNSLPEASCLSALNLKT
jgi:Fe-S-cluster containining protein